LKKGFLVFRKHSEVFHFQGLKKNFQGLEINYQSLEIIFQGLEINYQGLQFKKYPMLLEIQGMERTISSLEHKKKGTSLIPAEQIIRFTGKEARKSYPADEASGVI
jgi:hypothetical protein